MKMRLLSVILVVLSATIVHAATPVDSFPAAQRWRADDDDVQEIDDPYPPNGKPAWSRSTGGTWSTWRDNLLDGLKSAVDRTDASGKNHYNISIPASATDKTVAVWKVRVRYADSSTPILKVRCDDPDPLKSGYRVRLNFTKNLNPGTCLVTSGWTADDGATAASGGLVNTTDGKRYLPMALNEWHALRVEVDPVNGTFTAWLDPETGFSDRVKISGPAGTNTSNEIKFGHTETKSGVNEAATNCFAWAQGSDIPAFTEGPFELCTNGTDDDGDGLADAADPHCAPTAQPENTFAACGNGRDDDCDGLADCSDPDCAAISHCAEDQPYFALTLARQIGNWQGSGQQVYCSVYDENGTPLNGVVITDPVNGLSMTTLKDPGSADGQDGHARLSNPSFQRKIYRFYVSSYLGGQVASDVTPELHAWVGPQLPGYYSWQFEFMLKSRRDRLANFTPLDPTYIFDSVEMNTPPGPNNTLLDDLSGLDYDGQFTPSSTMFGQTFVANGNRIVSLRAELALPPFTTMQYEASIHELLNDPPASISDIGPAIGPARHSPANMMQSEWWNQMLLWPINGPDSVQVNPGQKYFLKVVRTDSPSPFTAFGSKNWYDGLGMKHSGDRYPNGERYRLAEDDVSLVVDHDPVRDRGFYDMVAYIVGATVSSCHNPVFDENEDQRVDAEDLTFFENCATGPGIVGNWGGSWAYCECMDHNKDQAIDQADFAALQRCLSGAGYADATCDDN